MIDKLNPVSYCNVIHKQKYLAILWPILLVVVTFIINHFYRLDEIKYVALLGLIWYLFTFIIYKINKPIPPEKTSGFVFSPINGKVKKIEKNQITIVKYFWHPVDIRNVNSEQNIEVNFIGKQPVLFEDFSMENGKLIGYKTGKLICKILLPDDYLVSVSISQKVIAGFSILGSRKI